MGLMTTPMEDYRVDWFRMLVQLQAEGYSLHGISYLTGIPKTSLINYKGGMQPSYHIGSKLIRCWAEATGNTPEAAPTISIYSFKA